jgi:hypothetical protein
MLYSHSQKELGFSTEAVISEDKAMVQNIAASGLRLFKKRRVRLFLEIFF